LQLDEDIGGTVQELYSAYRPSGTIPELKKLGRKHVEA